MNGTGLLDVIVKKLRSVIVEHMWRNAKSIKNVVPCMEIALALIDGFQLRDESIMLVHKTIANHCPRFAL